MKNQSKSTTQSRLRGEREQFKENWRKSMLGTFFGRRHMRGLALQYSTTILHMHQLFIKYRKMDCYLQDIMGWRVKLNTEHSPEGANSAHVES